MNILVPLADGFEEIEAITIMDVLRRAGLTLVTAGLPGTIIKGMHGIQVLADKKLDDVDTSVFDGLVLPGGPGHKNLAQSEKIIKTIQDFDSEKKLVAGICAAPAVLAKAGILDERTATIYPGMEREIPRPRSNRIVVEDNIITAQGPGVAMEFALAIVEKLLGSERSKKLAKELVC